MHIIGKVLLGIMVFLLIPLAILLTTMALDVRSEWQAAIQTRKADLVQTGERLSAVRVQVNELEGRLQSLTYNWGEVWDAPRVQPLPSGRGVQVGVGASSGLGRKAQAGQKQRIYVFSDGQNNSRYLGEFEIVQANADAVAAELLRDPYPGEVQNWPAGRSHVRDTLPPNWLATIADLEGDLLIVNSKLQFQQMQDSIIQRQLAASQTTLDQRLAELNGDADAPPGASQQVLDGLVETLRKLESERNSVLDDVHSLRVKLVREQLELEKTLETNRSLVAARETPQSDAPRTAGR